MADMRVFSYFLVAGVGPLKRPLRAHPARGSRTLKGLAAVAAAAAAVQMVPTPAHAYVLWGQGCRYDPNNDNDGLGIGFASSGFRQDMRDSSEDAAARWNAKMVPQFTLVAYGSSTRDLRIEFGHQPSNTGAITTVWCGSDHYTQDPLFTWNLDQGYYSNTGPHRTAIGVHEEGHSYGLNHNQTGGCDVKTAGLMFSDAVGKNNQCGWIDPTTDDVNGATDAHNG